MLSDILEFDTWTHTNSLILNNYSTGTMPIDAVVAVVVVVIGVISVEYVYFENDFIHPGPLFYTVYTCLFIQSNP